MADTQPTERLVVVSLTVPPGTGIGAPATTVFIPQVGYYIITKLEVVIPFGVAGLAGFALVQQGTWLAPWQQPNTYIIGDDEVAKVPVDFETSGALSFQGINSGVYAHTFTCRCYFSDISTAPVNSTLSTPQMVISSG